MVKKAAKKLITSPKASRKGPPNNSTRLTELANADIPRSNRYACRVVVDSGNLLSYSDYYNINLLTHTHPTGSDSKV